MEAIAALISAIAAAIALFASWRTAREAALRRADVLAWANDVIQALQCLSILCAPELSSISSGKREKRIRSIAIETSILAEKGRLFFRNTVTNDFGSAKQPAYRGYRPLILDHIVLAHQLAVSWRTADDERKVLLRLLAEDCLRQFVSLAQREVGRSRTAVSDTNRPGTGSTLDQRLHDLARHATSDGNRILETPP